ncbi:hypothetical protein DESC_930033 [Desulfosarcina cetonica]|nr:hypothetical protein DESC_930033 [Desulfosarcina cetonica]
MGFKGSEVQILSPRPENLKTIKGLQTCLQALFFGLSPGTKKPSLLRGSDGFVNSL